MQAVKAAMDELMAEIQLRQEAVDALRKLYPLLAGVIVAPNIVEHAMGQIPKSKTQNPIKSQAPSAKRQTSKGKRNGSISPTGKTLEDFLAIARRLQPPFRAEHLAKAAGVNWKRGSNVITALYGKALVRRVGVGEYELNEPAAKPKHEVLLGPGSRAPLKTKAQVESELEAATKERDQHRAEGRTTMEGIAQRKVDRLEEELEAFGKG